MVDINLVTSSWYQARKETEVVSMILCLGENRVTVCPVTSVLLETKERLLILFCFSLSCLYSVASSKLLKLDGKPEVG